MFSPKTLDELENIDRYHVRGVDIPRRHQLTQRAQFLVENIMWSDPEPDIDEYN